eukprot:1907680-Amphidinium_carterae.1
MGFASGQVSLCALELGHTTPLYRTHHALAPDWHRQSVCTSVSCRGDGNLRTFATDNFYYTVAYGRERVSQRSSTDPIQLCCLRYRLIMPAGSFGPLYTSE